MKNCGQWEGLGLEKSLEDCLPWEGPQAGAGEEGEEEGAAETCDELTTTLITYPPVPLVGRRVEKSGSKAKTGMKGGVGGRSF